MKKLILATILLTLPALAADKPNDNKPLPQETQIKLLKAERQIQQIQLQMSNLQRQYEDAVKQLKDLQIQMSKDCVAAAKDASVDLAKFTCDVDTLAFATRADDKKAAEKTDENKIAEKK